MVNVMRKPIRKGFMDFIRNNVIANSTHVFIYNRKAENLSELCVKKGIPTLVYVRKLFIPWMSVCQKSTPHKLMRDIALQDIRQQQIIHLYFAPRVRERSFPRDTIFSIKERQQVPYT